MILRILSRGNHLFSRWQWLVIGGDEILDKGKAWTKRGADKKSAASADRIQRELN